MATKCPPGLVPPTILNSTNTGGLKNMPNVLICFRSLKVKDQGNKKDDEDDKKKKKKRSKSCELRAGKLIRGCDCEKRNGLQDDCQRSECRGSPECLTIPPTCAPSEFAGNKHNTKIVEEYLRIKEEIAQLRKEGKTSDGKGKSDKGGVGPKAEYDCFPLEVFLSDGSPCPLCEKILENCNKLAGIAPITNVAPTKKAFSGDCKCC